MPDEPCFEPDRDAILKLKTVYCYALHGDVTHFDSIEIYAVPLVDPDFLEHNLCRRHTTQRIVDVLVEDGFLQPAPDYGVANWFHIIRA